MRVLIEVEQIIVTPIVVTAETEAEAVSQFNWQDYVEANCHEVGESQFEPVRIRSARKVGE